jgi:hypothetical protein
MRRALLLLSCLLTFAGCASSPEAPEAARQVVLKHVGEGVGTVGPFNRKDKKELASLSPADRAAANALLDRGALGFIVFGPDDGTKTAASGAALVDMVNVARILFVQHGELVGDFAAVK